MEKLVVPFKWIDTKIQVGVDTIVFFLMRRFGVRKSFLRYTLFSLVILSFVSQAFDILRSGGYLWVLPFFLLLPTYFLVQKRNLENDRLAEDRGMAYSGVDLKYSSILAPFKILFVVLLFNEVLICLVRGVSFSNVESGIFELSMILNFYLAKTPNTPPPQEDTTQELVRETA